MKSITLLRTALLAGMFSGLFAATASAQLITNGSFEAQPIGTFSNVTTTPDSSTFTGWTVLTSSGNSEVHSVGTGTPDFPTAVSGSTYLAFNGSDLTPGVAQAYQDFTTTIGQSYAVTFSAGRGGPADGTVGLQAQVFDVISGSASGGALGNVSSSSDTGGTGFYAPSAFSFVATGTTSRLLFSDLSTVTNSVDAVLDNVSVSAIPEPSTYAAIAGAATLGLAFWSRRRKTAAVAPIMAA